MKKNLILVFLLFLFFNCVEDSKVVQFNLNSISEDYEANIEVLYHQLEGKDINSTAINETIKKEFIKSISTDDQEVSNPNIDAALSAFDEEYKQFKVDFPGTEQIWQLLVETEVLYTSKEVISIALNTYIDTGGAHGNDSIIFLNFNPQSGDLYALSDIINNKEKLSELAKTYFIKEVMTTNDEDVIEDYFFGEPFQLPENIGFSDEGLIFLYNVYEIASYAEGYTEFLIPYKELNDLLKVN